jgi:exonuclease III
VSKLLNPDFTSLIENYDILVFQETKTDEFDQLLLPKDYSFRAKHRTKFQKKSGGIIIVFKNYLEPFLHFPDTESDFVQWLKLSKKILNLDADLLMGCVYIPPENTKYSSTDAFSDIENEMFNLVKNGEHVSLLGDSNRTVVVHIRRADVNMDYEQTGDYYRYIPNSYFLNLLKKIVDRMIT